MKKRIFTILLIEVMLLTGLLTGCTIKTATVPSTTECTEQTTCVTSTTESTEISPLVSNEYYVSPKNTGALQVYNGTLSDMSGNPIQLKGISTHGIARVENYINQDAFLEMRNDWGVNVIRLAMYIQSMDGYTKSDMYKQKNTEIMVKGVDLATACDMYVIIDWHVLDEKTPLKYVEEAKEFFDQMSSLYKNNINVLYEICNEPNDTSWDDIKEYADQIIPVIRANDPDSIIICGTPEYSQRVDEALESPLDYDNVMYTLHFYSAAHKDELRNRMVDCVKAGLPIFVTEYGITNSDGKLPRDVDEANKWMDVMDENNISCCMWCLSNSGDACNLLKTSCTKFSGFTDEDFTETGSWFMDMMSNYKTGLR